MRNPLGFGRYEFQVTGRLDRFDENVVLGLFNYPTREVGPDGTHEIDIEFAHWGNPRAPVGNYTVWPVANSLKQVTKSFRFDQPDEATTHRFTWGKQGVKFQSYRGLQDDGEEIQSWDYLPTDASERVSKQPMPVHINLWLFRGRPPRDGEEVEVIINRFRFTAEGQ